MALHVQKCLSKSPTSEGDFPHRGKWFSGTENVLRTSKHNLPCACAHSFSVADFLMLAVASFQLISQFKFLLVAKVWGVV